jgi:REP element-mobilizing transposase RayT
MSNYRKTSYAAYDLKYHFVWITKYRKPVLIKEVAVRVRELIGEICKSVDIEIVKGHVSKEHVHLSVPPYHTPSIVMKRIKGKTSRKLLSESRLFARQFWGLICGFAGILSHHRAMEPMRCFRSTSNRRVKLSAPAMKISRSADQSRLQSSPV